MLGGEVEACGLHLGYEVVAGDLLPDGRTHRGVALPEVDVDHLTAGPQIARLEAPIDRLPLLVRAGSIVPAWPVMQHTDEKPIDELTLRVYAGAGESPLYEDEGSFF